MGEYEVPYPVVTQPTASVEHVATFTVAWAVTGGGPAAKTFDVRYRGRKPGHAFGPFHSLADHTTHLHQSFTGQFGLEYCFSARATDEGGNTSPFGPERCVSVEK